MTVVDSQVDPAQRTFTLVAEFPAPPARVWTLWEDPRKLERWWGPPGWPATFVRHEFVPGGESRYFMTGPGGERGTGWWRSEVVDPVRRIEFLNGLAAEDGEPVPDLAPAREEVDLEGTETGTRMTVVTRFADDANMERMLAMGMREGLTLALEQADGVLDSV